MELLAEVRERDVGFEGMESFVVPYELRKTSRAVVFNENNEIALLAVTKHNYHKLLGGGIEENEDLYAALKCKVLEEIGCHIEIGRDLGLIIEYRNRWKRLQISYCFLAKTTGEIQESQLTESELEKGIQPLWVPLDKAVALLEHDKPSCYEGKFIQRRDIAFLQRSKDISP